MGLSQFDQFRQDHPIRHFISLKLYNFAYRLCKFALWMRNIDHEEFLKSYARSVTSGPRGIVK